MKSFNPENGRKMETGFRTPDNYFEGFEDRLMDVMGARKAKVVPLATRYRNAFYAAAAIIIIALAIPIVNRIKQPSAQIDDAALEHYLAYESGISQFDLLTALDQSDIETIEEQSALPVSDEAIEEMLSEHNIEHLINE